MKSNGWVKITIDSFLINKENQNKLGILINIYYEYLLNICENLECVKT